MLSNQYICTTHTYTHTQMQHTHTHTHKRNTHIHTHTNATHTHTHEHNTHIHNTHTTHTYTHHTHTQSKLLHMKQCAKRDGISTEALVQLNRVAVESLLTAPLTAPLSNQSNCPAVTSETAAGGEMDFKPSLSKGRKPKKQKAPTE